MKALLQFAKGIDYLNHKASHLATWAVLFAALISAGNAFIRYGFDKSSNGWLEIQWYLFAVTVMLGTGYVLQLNEHVRVDIFYGKLKRNGSVYVDLFGLIFFLLPVTIAMVYLSFPLFMGMLKSGEMSNNAGGLIRWPAMLMLPLGFSLLTLQGVSEIIKRVGHLTGDHKMDLHYEKPVQ